MRILFKILVIGALVFLGSCRKHQPTVKYVTDPLIYDYLMKYDNGTYWVMETTHKDSTRTQDTIFVKDAKCTLRIHNDGGCEDDEPKTCDYEENLKYNLISSTIPCHLFVFSNYFSVNLGCSWDNYDNSFDVANRVITNSRLAEIAKRITIIQDTTISSILYRDGYKVKIYDCINKQYGNVCFSREHGFFLWVFDDFTARLKSSKIILRQNLCRNNSIK